jgi:hypothetical protein
MVTSAADTVSGAPGGRALKRRPVQGGVPRRAPFEVEASSCFSRGFLIPCEIAAREPILQRTPPTRSRRLAGTSPMLQCSPPRLAEIVAAAAVQQQLRVRAVRRWIDCVKEAPGAVSAGTQETLDCLGDGHQLTLLVDDSYVAPGKALQAMRCHFRSARSRLLPALRKRRA